MSTPRPHRLLLATGAALTALTLTACSGGDGGAGQDSPAGTAEQETTASAAPAPSPDESDASATGTASTSASASGGGTEESTRTSRNASTDDADDELSEEVEEVADRFSTLAPRSFFQEFDSCNATGLEGSFECSGPKVGQFQFFDSQSKAASTTQLLTELRSSRVVEDTGRKVVGWSTLGTTAVITVVDNELGLVAQQLVSSDLEDPEQRIYELGLAERPDTATTTSNSPASQGGGATFSTADERREA